MYLVVGIVLREDVVCEFSLAISKSLLGYFCFFNSFMLFCPM